MPQIILKGRKLHLASFIFLQEMLINIRTRQFNSSIKHQEHFFYRTLTTSYFSTVNIAAFYMQKPRNYSICLTGQKILATVFVMKTNQVLRPFSTTTEKTICSYRRLNE